MLSEKGRGGKSVQRKVFSELIFFSSRTEEVFSSRPDPAGSAGPGLGSSVLSY